MRFIYELYRVYFGIVHSLCRGCIRFIYGLYRDYYRLFEVGLSECEPVSILAILRPLKNGHRGPSCSLVYVVSNIVPNKNPCPVNCVGKWTVARDEACLRLLDFA